MHTQYVDISGRRVEVWNCAIEVTGVLAMFLLFGRVYCWVLMEVLLKAVRMVDQLVANVDTHVAIRPLTQYVYIDNIVTVELCGLQSIEPSSNGLRADAELLLELPIMSPITSR